MFKSNNVAEIIVSYKPKRAPQPTITDAESALKYVYPHFNKRTIHLKEQVLLVLMNRANMVLGVYKASEGGINSSITDPKVLLSVALKGAASSIILCHNHPSGNLKASQSDLDITRKIKEACKLLDMNLLDHIIVAPNGGFLSLADEGKM